MMMVTLHCLTEKSINTIVVPASWKWTFTLLCLCCGVLAGSILLLRLSRWIRHSVFFLLWSQEVMDSFLNVWPENMVQLGIHHLSYNSVHTRLQHSGPMRIVENFLQLILYLWFQLKPETPILKSTLRWCPSTIFWNVCLFGVTGSSYQLHILCIYKLKHALSSGTMVIYGQYAFEIQE